jgi:hypothetical protein
MGRMGEGGNGRMGDEEENGRVGEGENGGIGEPEKFVRIK